MMAMSRYFLLGNTRILHDAHAARRPSGGASATPSSAGGSRFPARAPRPLHAPVAASVGALRPVISGRSDDPHRRRRPHGRPHRRERTPAPGAPPPPGSGHRVPAQARNPSPHSP